eukprot:COSAG06_NODE_76559_length_121_cov_16.000000_1_plen_22_part_01
MCHSWLSANRAKASIDLSDRPF